VSAGCGRRVRFPVAEENPAGHAAVPSIGPVVFSVRLGGVDHHIDLSDLPCPRLVRRLAQALTTFAGEDGTQRSPRTVHATAARIRDFVTFIAAAETAGAGGFGLEDLTPGLLDAYEHRLLAGYGDKSKLPYAAMVDVVHLLKVAHRQHPAALGIDMQARLGFSTTAARSVTNPLDCYPLPVFEAMQAKAIEDVRSTRDRILRGEHLVRAGEDPEIAGWTLENALWHIAHRGPLTQADRRRPGLLHQLNRLGGIRRLNSMLFLTAADLVPFQVLLTCQTGLEPECIRGLRADCLVNPARGFVSIAYVKAQAHGQSGKAMRVSDGGALHYPGGVLRLALRLTQHARQRLGTDWLWVEVADAGLLVSFDGPRTMSLYFQAWLVRHGLHTMTDRGGRLVRLDLRRLRKTYKSLRYRRSGGVLDDFADGHTKEVAAGHYANIEAHRELHETAVENGLREALDVALAPPVVLGDDGTRLDSGAAPLEPGEVRAALSGQSDVFLASCKDFYASPYSIKKGAGCPVAVWGCLECPNAVFTTRHLPGILSFLAFVEEQRDELPGAEWKARYGLARDRIVQGIRPRFTADQIATAQAIAEAGNARLRLPAQFLAHSL
jgi:hypothetical protein